MNCTIGEERIALYSGADLPPDEAREVELHLAECSGCREVLEELRSSRKALRRLAASESFLSATAETVRNRVMAEVETSRIGALSTRVPPASKSLGFPMPSWRWALAAVAATAILAVWLSTGRIVDPPLPPQQAERSEPVAVLPAEPPNSAPPEASREQAVEREQVQPESGLGPPTPRREVARTLPAPIRASTAAFDRPPARFDPGPEQAAVEKSTVAKIITDDPNVVIYWVLETEGID